MPSNLPQAIEYSNQRILTTKQIADAYGTEPRIISNNFTRNKDRYTIGKHYYCLEGEDKKAFLDHHHFNHEMANRAKVLYLWTFEGCVVHFNALRRVSLSTLLELARIMNVDASNLLIVKPESKEWEFGDALTKILDGIATVKPQHPVNPYYIDFYIPEFKLAVEFDESHHSYLGHQDQERQQYIATRLQCRFIRIKWDEELPTSLNKVMKAILDRHVYDDGPD